MIGVALYHCMRYAVLWRSFVTVSFHDTWACRYHVYEQSNSRYDKHQIFEYALSAVRPRRKSS